MIDRRMVHAAVLLLACAVFSSVGLIHSVRLDGALYLPWQVSSPLVLQVTAGYLLLALMCAVLARPAASAGGGTALR